MRQSNTACSLAIWHFVYHKITNNLVPECISSLTLIISTIGCCRMADDAVENACRFLCSKQMDDGGWGEDFRVWLTDGIR